MTPAPAAAKGASAYGWYVLVLLTAVHVLGYIDRWILSLLIEPIKADLGLNDFEIGLLLGPAFALLFITMGVPFGWLADRVERRRLLAAGIALWCLFTAGSCMARDFTTLFIMRMGVGVGEAVLAPCAFSLIADYFPAMQRPRAVSVFMTGTFIGAGTAFLIGGPIITHLESLPVVAVPLIGQINPWQGAFLGVGLPGLMVAAIVLLTVKEPQRSDLRALNAGPGAGGDGRGIGVALGFVLKRWRTFGAISAGAIGNIIIGSNAQWVAPIFARNWGWEVGVLARTTGILFFIAGPLGTIAGIWLMSELARRGKTDAAVRALILGVVVVAVSFALLPLAPAATLALVALFGALFGQAIATAAGPTSMIAIAPGNIRGQIMAFYYLANGLVANFLGAPVVGALADHLGRKEGLGQAILIVSSVVGPLVVILLLLGLKPYRGTVREIEALTPVPPAAPTP